MIRIVHVETNFLCHGDTLPQNPYNREQDACQYFFPTKPYRCSVCQMPVARPVRSGDTDNGLSIGHPYHHPATTLPGHDGTGIHPSEHSIPIYPKVPTSISPPAWTYGIRQWASPRAMIRSQYSSSTEEPATATPCIDRPTFSRKLDM